jgi:hypothetical protein
LKYELFHRIGDDDSAAARRALVERGLAEDTSFRNIHYPEAEADFRARGGSRVPALWDGERLVEGLPAILALLDGAGS